MNGNTEYKLLIRLYFKNIFNFAPRITKITYLLEAKMWEPASRSNGITSVALNFYSAIKYEFWKKNWIIKNGIFSKTNN